MKTALFLFMTLLIQGFALSQPAMTLKAINDIKFLVKDDIEFVSDMKMQINKAIKADNEDDVDNALKESTDLIKYIQKTNKNIAEDNKAISQQIESMDCEDAEDAYTAGQDLSNQIKEFCITILSAIDKSRMALNKKDQEDLLKQIFKPADDLTLLLNQMTDTYNEMSEAITNCGNEDNEEAE